jgi:hypothetical protein
MIQGSEKYKKILSLPARQSSLFFREPHAARLQDLSRE